MPTSAEQVICIPDGRLWIGGPSDSVIIKQSIENQLEVEKMNDFEPKRYSYQACYSSLHIYVIGGRIGEIYKNCQKMNIQ